MEGVAARPVAVADRRVDRAAQAASRDRRPARARPSSPGRRRRPRGARRRPARGAPPSPCARRSRRRPARPGSPAASANCSAATSHPRVPDRSGRLPIGMAAERPERAARARPDDAVGGQARARLEAPDGRGGAGPGEPVDGARVDAVVRAARPATPPPAGWRRTRTRDEQHAATAREQPGPERQHSARSVRALTIESCRDFDRHCVFSVAWPTIARCRGAARR